MLLIAAHVNRLEYKDGAQIISATLYFWQRSLVILLSISIT